MNEMTETGTALALPEGRDLAVIFRASDQMDALIGRIEAEVRSHAPDVTTAKGRKAIASLAYKVAQSKTALDEAGKALNEAARQQINAVDAERRKVRDRLDALRDEARAPLTAWEKAEEERVQRIKDRLEKVRTAHTMLPEGATAEQIAALLARVEAMAIDDTWAEFVADAARYKDQAVATLRNMQAEATRREAQEAELARLRAEAEARAEADRKRAEAEAAEAGRVAAEKAEAERQARIEQEKQEAAARAAAEAEARAKAEADRLVAEAKAAADRAAQEAAEREAALLRRIEEDRQREEKARQEAEAARIEAETRHAREMAEAAAAQERAAQAERDRVAALAKAEADARAKREADAAHRARIKADISAALATMAGAATPDAIADALIAGKIPHVVVVM